MNCGSNFRKALKKLGKSKGIIPTENDEETPVEISQATQLLNEKEIIDQPQLSFNKQEQFIIFQNSPSTNEEEQILNELLSKEEEIDKSNNDINLIENITEVIVTETVETNQITIPEIIEPEIIDIQSAKKNEKEYNYTSINDANLAKEEIILEVKKTE